MKKVTNKIIGRLNITEEIIIKLEGITIETAK